MQFTSKLAAAALAFGTVLGLPVRAATITYDFSTTIIDGPVAGNTYSGQFSYDSSSITPGMSNDQTGLLTQLSFSFRGVAFTSATFNTGALGFDASGALNIAIFGNNCNAGGCSAQAGLEQLYFVVQSVGGGSFYYTGPDTPNDIFGGDASFRLVQPVPEPISAALLGAGLLGLGLMRRRLA